MANVKLAYAGPTNITITLGSPLTNGSCRGSVYVDNSANLYEDAEIYLAIKLAAGSPASDKAINVYAYGSVDGTNFTDNALGTDAAITLRVPTNLRHIGTISTPDSGALTYKAVIPSIAAAFGGWLPKYWGIAVENRTGLSFDSTEGNFTKQYLAIYHTVS